jgi:hypothetical protein
MGADYIDVPPLTTHYTVNDLEPNAYTYGTSGGWISGPQQITLLQTDLPSSMNAAPNVTFDPFQKIPSLRTTYMDPNTYEVPISFPQQSQQGSGAMQQHNYNR